MTDTALRTAIVGYGLAGSVFHAPLVAATEGLEVTAVVTADPGRAHAAQDRYPRARVVASVEALLDRPDELDLVVVASPNASHVPVALAAIGAGLGVVVDKPVAATVRDAHRLRDAATAAGVLLAVFHNRRWDDDARTLADLVAGGALGEVHRFESRFERWRPQPRPDAWREDPDPAAAGGLLYDLGSHLIDQAVWLFGAVSTVYAQVRAVRPAAAVDDDVFVALVHAGGVRSHLWASSAAADLGPRLRVLGSTAGYVSYGLDGQEEALRQGRTPADPGWGVRPDGGWARLGTPDDHRPVPGRPGAYQDFYAGVREAWHGRAPVPVTIDEAATVLAVIEAAQRSARDSAVVSL